MLFIPTRDLDIEIYTNATIQKGQLYNLDLDQWINFQFNPTAFEWGRETKWSEHNFVGGLNGGDLQFINVGPRKVDLDLLFIADPRAPLVNYEANFNILDANGLVDFQAVKETIEAWEELLPQLLRPSRIAIVVGPNVFEGVILNSQMRITEFFEDLTPKEAMLTIGFREWIPV